LPGTSKETACKSTYRFRKLKNRVLRKVFRSKGTRAIGRWRKLYTEVLHGLYSLSNIIRVIRLRRRRWMENVAVWKRRGIHAGLWRGNLKERNHLEGLEVDERIILEFTF